MSIDIKNLAKYKFGEVFINILVQQILGFLYQYYISITKKEIEEHGE